MSGYISVLSDVELIVIFEFVFELLEITIDWRLDALALPIVKLDGVHMELLSLDLRLVI